jgi:hypothetical protein
MEQGGPSASKQHQRQSTLILLEDVVLLTPAAHKGATQLPSSDSAIMLDEDTHAFAQTAQAAQRPTPNN